MTESASLGPTTILLDTQASVHIVCNADLLTSIDMCEAPIYIQGITRDRIKVTQQGILRQIGAPSYFSPLTAANILSYSLLKSTHLCSYNASTDAFTAIPRVIGPTLIFKNNFGHYSLDIETVTSVFISRATALTDKYSKRQLSQAQLAYDFILRMGYVSYKSAAEMVQRSSMAELGFTRADLVNAQAIFRTPAAYQLGHGTASASPTMSQERVPTEQATPQELQVDLFFIFGQVFLLSISVLLGLVIVSHLGPGIDRTDHRSIPAKSRAKAGSALLTHIETYDSKGFTIHTVTTDGEPAIVALKATFDTSNIHLNVLGHGSHVPHAEAAIRHLKNKARSVVWSLPYTLPLRWAPALITFAVHTINMVPKINSPGHVPAYTAFTGLLPNFKKQAPHPFGITGFLQRPTGPSHNSSAARADYCVWLGTTRNQAGTHKCFNLATLSEITGNKFTPAPITPEAAVRISRLAGASPDSAPPSSELLSDPNPPSALDPHRGEDTSSSSQLESELDLAASDVPLYIPEPEPDNHLDTSEPNQFDQFDEFDTLDQADTVDLHSDSHEPPGLHDPTPAVNDEQEDDEDQDLVDADDTQVGELVAVRNSHRYNLRRSTSDQHIYAAMTVNEAKSIYGKEAVRLAGITEVRNCLDKDVWECIMPSTKTSRPIPSKLFLTPKMTPTGEFKLLKGRIVGGGHRQDASLFADNEVSSPTVSLTSVLLGAAVAAYQDRHILTLDHTAAYLNASMKGPEVIMLLTPDVTTLLIDIDESNRKYVRADGKIAVKLKKALYGCLQSAMLWYNELSSTLESMGFQKNPYDVCSLRRVTGINECTILIYVDDLLITSTDKDTLSEVASRLKDKYGGITTKEGRVHDYLGIRWDFSTSKQVTLSMDGYVRELLTKFSHNKQFKTPAGHNLYDTDEHSAALGRDKREAFHSCVMTLHYLAKRVRPDILAAVSYCATRVLSPTLEDQSKLERILGYLSSTPLQTLILKIGDSFEIRAYVDSSYGTYADAKSVTGTVIMLGEAPVYFKSSKQKIVTRSSTEAELVGISDALSQVLWTREYMIYQGFKIGPVTLYQDNCSTIFLANKGRSTSERTRHIKIRYFFITHYINNKEIVIEHMPTSLMIADILTKSLHGTLFTEMTHAITGHPHNLHK